MDGLTEGRIVHLSLGNLQGDCRAAIVTRVLDKQQGTVELTVFWTTSDQYNNLPETTYVRYDENKGYGTWHWIEKA